jgi:hypothetical protein
MRAKLAFVLLAAMAACGGDDDDGGAPRPAGGGAAPAAAPKVDSKNKLVPRVHVEDVVGCPVPEKPTGPACELLDTSGSGAPPASSKTVAECEPGRYCLLVGAGHNCEPCAERDRIRHDFMDRDFVADQSRDPFFNYVVTPVGLGDNSNNAKPEPHQSCKRRDQFVATNYSFQDLKLIGIVSERSQRKVMGVGYITFVVEEDPDSKRPAQETSVQLHPNAIAVEPSGPELAPETNAPIVAPPGPVTGLGASRTPPQAPAPRTPPVQVVSPPSQ